MGRKRPAEEPPMDFRSKSDDAWYGVRLRLEDGEVLRVMYKDFSETFDERYPAGQFETLADVDEFRARFRPTSVQLQDEECRKAIEGMEVCASHCFGEDDLRFYDAVIDSVSITKHEISKKDPCTCSFEVLWQHGPLAGEKASKRVEDLCLLQSKCSENPILNNFLDMARRKLEASTHMGPTATGLPLKHRGVTESVNCHHSRDSSMKKPQVSMFNQKVEFAGDEDPKSTSDKKNTSRARSFDQRMSIKSKDLRGESLNNICPEESYYVIWIENLEKDLSPSAVMDFLYEQTCVSALVVICPCWVSEMPFRGAIFVKTKEKADQLLEFLLSSAHIVVSSRGRPWVICNKRCGAVEGAMPNYEKNERRKNEKHSREIRLVYQGTKEYEKADQLLKLHLEFHDHIHGLVQRLASEEKGIILER